MGPSAGQHTGSVIILLRTADGLTGIGDVIVKGGDPRLGRAPPPTWRACWPPPCSGRARSTWSGSSSRLWGITTHDSTVYAAGVDVALHDLMGKALGVPLYRLLGGRYRERVPLTWNVPATRDIDLMVRQAGDAVARGFRNVVKVKTGTPWDVEALVAIREAIGPDVPLRPDDNGAFLAGDSIRRFGTARDRGVVFECLEQPAPNDDLPGLRRVGDALGERVMYHVGYVRQSVAYEIIRSRACDVVSVPVFRHGLRQTSQLVRAFELAGIGCAMGSGLDRASRPRPRSTPPPPWRTSPTPSTPSAPTGSPRTC